MTVLLKSLIYKLTEHEKGAYTQRASQHHDEEQGAGQRDAH